LDCFIKKEECKIVIFFNSHKKTGKKIGQSIKEVLHQPFNSLGKSVPDNLYTDHYIYGFINASTTNLMAFVFGGKDWSQQKKGECIMEALLTIDPSNTLLDFHIDNNFDSTKIQALQNSKNFKQGMNDATTIVGVIYGFLKPDDPDPILQKAKKLADKTESMSAMFGEKGPNGHLGGVVTSLTLMAYIKKKFKIFD
tara:strand:+ start:351 stop:938 length:588 start_codon:yes stop_codon:yes gene_type:complete